MKKYIYIFLFFAALLTAACVEPMQPQPNLLDLLDEEDGPTVTLEFSLPPQTKGAMSHDPSIATIHVAVFNKAGVLKQFEQAVLTNPGNVTNGSSASNPTYSVDIHMSAKPRILHFIADSPITTFDELVAAAGTSGEDVILNALTTSGGQAAYWQRFELDRVDAYKYQGGVYTDCYGHDWGTAGGNSYEYTDAGQSITVNKGDYIKRDGHKVLDGTGYFQSDYVKGVISNVPFVRNFAEITVTGMDGTNFIPKQFALVNVPTHGFVAPYDAEAGLFAEAYTNCTSSGFTGFTHDGVAGTGYPGTLAGALNTSLPTEFINLEGSGNHNAYMYERPLPNTSQPSTCILVGGLYDHDQDGNYADNDGAVREPGTGLTWLMIEVDKDGAYFPIYRGLSYTIRIGTVEGTKGYASAADAYNAEPIGDISSSVTTATLTQINDGKGTTLWVSYIDYVATEAQTKTIYYTMYYEDSGVITYLNDGVTATVSHPDDSYKAILSIDTSDAATYTSGTPDDSKEWKMISVRLADNGQFTKRSVLRISGNAHNGKTMYRDVQYRVMDTQEFKNGNNVLKGTALASENSGEQTTLTIYLPNDLGFSMFPLTLCIEAKNGGFTTADSPGLPVEYGPSLFDASKTAFYFLKTIEYEDYYNASTGVTTNSFTATFKTTRNGTTSAAGTNATDFRVLDKVKTGRNTTYFDVAECYVPVGSTSVFEFSYNGTASTGVSVDSDETSVTFGIRSTGDSNPTWTLSTSGDVSSLSASPSFSEGYSGTGSSTITVTFPENTDTHNAKTYTVTASRSGFADMTFTITQAKLLSGSVTINLDAGDSNSTNGYPWVASTNAYNPDGGTYYCYQSANEGVDDGIATMSVTITGYTEFTVYIRSYAESSYDYVVVRKLDASPLTGWSNYAYSDSGTKSDAHTCDRQSNNTAIVTGTEYEGYRAVTFTTADGLTDDDTPHTFYIQYGKDYSTARGDDRGYVLIPKEYNISYASSNTVEFTYADFGGTFANTGTPQDRSATKGNIQVSISNIITIATGYSSEYGGVVEVQKGSTPSLVTVSPTVSGTTITDVQIEFLRYKNTNYNPSSISGPFSGGTGTSNTSANLIASYNGSGSTSAITATLTPYSSVGFDIVHISVTYNYEP